MGESTANGNREPDDLLRRAEQGDAAALAELFDCYRERLRRMVKLRMDRRLQGRVDASDVLQEAYLDFADRIGEYLVDEQPQLPVYLWLRFLTGQRLAAVFRRHLGAQARDVRQEVSLYQGRMPQATSFALANQLLGRLTSPSHAAVRAEMQLKLQDALMSMDAMDREVLTLRHFEELSNKETAAVLEISKTAASNRYVRAMKRLKELLDAIPGFFE